MTELRTPSFRRNECLDKFIREINEDLNPAENFLVNKFQHPTTMKYPLIFIMGPLRSGSTLFMQWLANTSLCAYPTNFLSRFYGAPIIGAKLQLLMTDPKYNFRDELGEFCQSSEYISENGKTRGVLSPNEFWYFWRRFLAVGSRDVWADDELQRTMDVPTMKAELVGLMDVFQKPFAAKGMLFNYNIPFIDSVLEKVLFIQIKRDPVANVASVLEARKRQLGSEREWYSFKIPEYERLKDLDPVSQCAGQVHFINKTVSQGMAKVDETRKMVLQYEDFCVNPEEVFSQLTEKLGLQSNVYGGPEKFESTRTNDDSSQDEIKKALAVFDLK